MKIFPKITIIGAGLTGLSCAYYLEQAGFTPTLIEKNTSVGGRIQTDHFNGFLLDRGFQVVLNNYPEFKTLFNANQLQLKPIPSGALIYFNKQWITVDNPLKKFSPLQWKNLSFMQTSDLKAFAKGLWIAYQNPPQETTEIFLRECGFSDMFINAFWRPFFGGVFLELPLQTNAQTFIWLARYFATGHACLPSLGMQAIPLNLAKRLKRTSVRLDQTVQSIQENQIELTSGEILQTDATVIATSGMQATHLVSFISSPDYHAVTCLYFTFSTTCRSFSPYLHLNGSSQGPINNLLFNHLIQPSYAPAGKGLVSVSVVDADWQKNSQLLAAVKDQLSEWFQLPNQTWEHLKTYQIMQALPDQSQDRLLFSSTNSINQSLYICGELTDEPSINGALYSGRKMAQQLSKTAKYYEKLTH